MVTLKDISKITGVSPSTISRILKNDSTLNVNAKTREKVLNACKELDYKVKNPKSNKLNILIFNWYIHDQEVIDPYYYYIRKGVESECTKLGYSYEVKFKDENLSGVNNFDGIIAIGKFSTRQVKELELISSNIVFIDSNPDYLNYDSVQVDFNDIIKKIFIKFVQDKASNVGLLIGEEEVDGQKISDKRLDAFEKYANKFDVSYKEYIKKGEFTLKSGYEMFQSLYSDQKIPEILICGNDLIAIGANKAAIELGLIPGKDFKLIGINDIPISKYMVPALSTVKIYQEEMGKEAVLLLKKRIENIGSIKVNVTVPSKLIKREST